MTKVLVVSDSHGLTTELSEIKARHGCQYKIHCGDSELDYDDQAMDGFIRVRGNCDFDERYPLVETREIAGVNFYICHGHLHKVHGGLDYLSYTASEVGAQIVCHGHTHRAHVTNYPEQIVLNPGSIRSPRTRKEKTYCILEWTDPKEIDVQFYLETGEPFVELSQTMTCSF